MGACEPECPWEAIFEDVSVPEVLKEDTPLNAEIVEAKDDFEVPQSKESEQPTPDPSGREQGQVGSHLRPIPSRT